jgi:hypothetical protein
MDVSFANVDLAQARILLMQAQNDLQLRLEGYNVFNHANTFVIGSEADGRDYAKRLGSRVGSPEVRWW